MNDASYLLGSYEKPVVPEAWAPQDEEITAVSPWSAAFHGLLSRTVLQRQNDLLGEMTSLQEGPNADNPMWQFILLRSTWETFAEIGITQTESIGSAIARLDDGDLGIEQSIGLLDLLISIEQVGPVDPSHASSLDSALELLLDSIHHDGWRPLGERRETCLRREGWGYAKATLQQIGDELGVTRERARQIVNELDWTKRSTLRTVPLDPTLSVATLIENSRRAWDPRNVESFLTAIGHAGLVEAGKRQARADRELGEALRKLRNPLGFIDCRAVRNALGINATNAALERACSTVYTVCVREGDWLMASTLPHPNAVTCVLEQLAITTSLSAAEAAEGVRRQGRGRTVAVPPEDVLIPLLLATGKLARDADANLRPAIGVEAARPNGIADWLTLLIEAEPDRVVHRDKIITSALAAGHNVSTVIHYLLYHHCIRGCGQDCFSIVGHVPSDDEIASAARVAAIARTSTAIEFRVVDGNVEITITCGNTLMNSANAGTTAELRALLPIEQIPVSCCGQAIAGPRIHNGGSLINLRGVLAHLQAAHGFQLGDRFTLIVSPAGDASLRTP